MVMQKFVGHMYNKNYILSGKSMNKLKELCKQIKEFPSYYVLEYMQYHGELQKYSEICRLINAIADLSSNKVARVLDDTIKQIAYASAESNFEIRKQYLSEAIIDLLGGMDETDVLLKYEDILHRYKGWY